MDPQSVRAHPAQTNRDARRERDRAVKRVAFEVRPAEAEIRVVETIYDRVRLDVAIVDTSLPIPRFLQRGAAHLQVDDPGSITARESAAPPQRLIRTAVVDGDRSISFRSKARFFTHSPVSEI